MTRLSNIKPIGRFKNSDSKKEVNLKSGKNRQRGTDHIFYLYRGQRVFVSDADFYSNKKWIRV
jgi:hypothetical protein